MLAVRQVLVVVKCLKILVIMAQTQNEVIANLIKNGAEVVTVKVKTIKVQVFEKWTRLRLGLDSQVDGYVDDGNGGYKLGKTDTIFVSMYNVLNALRETDYDILVEHFYEHPKAALILLKKASLKLVKQSVKKGDALSTGEVAEHDTIFWWIDTITFDSAVTDDANGIQSPVNRIIDSILGI